MKKKNKFTGLFILVLSLCLISMNTIAAQKCSMQITITGEANLSICVHHVADKNGTLLVPYAEAEISAEDMLRENADEQKENAEKLYTFIIENKIAGENLVTDEEGVAPYNNLEEGIYLIYCTDEQVFVPFLVSLPTEVDGELYYDVAAVPKHDESQPDLPSEPEPEPQPSTDTELDEEVPQTGINEIPMYALMIGGTVITMIGLAELVKGRKEKHE